MTEEKKPVWFDENASEDFTTSLKEGIEMSARHQTARKNKFIKKGAGTIDITKIQNLLVQGDRANLAKAITLVESNAQQHFEPAQELLKKCFTSYWKCYPSRDFGSSWCR